MSLCENYGVNKLPLCPNELVPSNTDYRVSWRCFETRIVGQGEDGKPRK